MTVTLHDPSGVQNGSAEIVFNEWNNSAIYDLEKCGHFFYRRWILKDRRARRTPLVRGSAFHLVSRTVYLRKKNEGDYPTVEEVRDLAADLFEQEWDREDAPIIDAEELSEHGSADAVRGELKDFVIDIAAHDRAKVADSINPVAVEHKVVVQPSDSDITIHGTMDLVHGGPEGEVVIDKKSGTKAPSKNSAHASQQFDMYGLIRLLETGSLPVGYRQDHVYRTPAKKEVKYVPLDTTRTLDDLKTMVRRINVAVEAVKKGVFIPTNPANWWCSEKWCEYWSDCPYAHRGNRPQD